MCMFFFRKISPPLYTFFFIEAIPIHREYGQKNKSRPGNPLWTQFMPKVVSSFARFGMWGGFQIQVTLGCVFSFGFWLITCTL